VCLAVLSAVLLAVIATGAACERPALTPAQIDHIHGVCSRNLDKVREVSSDRVHWPDRAAPSGTPVVVYGASWCKACDATAAYLTGRGIPFVDRDIEEDDGAAAERVATLRRASLPVTGTIPIVDVRGTVTEGFLPCVVEAAWAAP
jgi:glutaredoxin